MTRISETTPAYWDDLITSKQEDLRLDAWRKYMTWVYQKLMDEWFHQKSSLLLKTDLFEEACTRHSLLADMANNGIGLDHSLQIAKSAKHKLTERMSGCRLIVCDLRELPFLSSTFEQILSPSSLDHFERIDDIDLALAEIARVLKPGGVLILTLDNPDNPVVWIRNHLPFVFLNRLGLVPYYTGPTCSAEEAREKLHRVGMEITHCTAVAHVPRMPAIWMVMLAEAIRSERMANWLSRHFEKWEAFQRFPSLYRTGYYTALRAVKWQR